MQRLTDSSVLPLHTLKEHTCHTAANALYLSLSQCWRGHLVSSYGCAGVAESPLRRAGMLAHPRLLRRFIYAGEIPAKSHHSSQQGESQPADSRFYESHKTTFFPFGSGFGSEQTDKV